MSQFPAQSPPGARLILRVFAFLFLLILAGRGVSMYVEDLWFSSVGFRSIYWTRIGFQLGAFLIFALATAVTLLLLLRLVLPRAMESRTSLEFGGETLEVPGTDDLKRIASLASVGLGLLFGLAYSVDWSRYALFLNQPPATGQVDPILGQDLNFYLFAIPTYDAIAAWFLAISVVVLIAGAVSATLDRSLRFRGLSIGLGLVLGSLALQTELGRFHLLYRDNALFSGVSYVHDAAVLPALRVLAIALVLGAIGCAYNYTASKVRNLVIAVAIPSLVYAVGLVLIPGYVTNFVVRPNELARETPYIRHNIEQTRAAFSLDNVEEIAFNPLETAVGFDPEEHSQTLENVRLWDWRALQDTLQQIQEIRTYYDFSDVDVDRYEIDGEIRSMMLATRELNRGRLPTGTNAWLSERLIYTHGYGVTMNPVNRFTDEGLPELVLYDMPVQSSSDSIRVDRPEIYFGEMTDWHVYVNTNQQEFNYPEGDSGNYSTYEADAGIRVGSMLRRLLLAYTTGELATLPFANDVTPDSQLLMRRNIRERVEEIAPFLMYDNDAYMVVGDDGSLYWMMDAFTTSDRYPYSRPVNLGTGRINYIRNSVKVVVNAYDGRMTFYVFDTDDPVIQAYRNVFPDLFVAADTMPATLQPHVRYPELLFQIQALIYSRYHVEDERVFYNQEDLWAVAQQSRSQAGSDEIEPYFVLLRFPGEDEVEFVSILPFTPASRNNLIGWMAARSDGDAYGKLRAYTFPESRFVDGPLQVEARIDQDPELSSQLSLWNQQGSTVLRGNLLVIPLDETLLFVSPIYLQAERSPMPELRIVVLATEDRMVYGDTFDEALRRLLDGQSAVVATTAFDDLNADAIALTDPTSTSPGETPAPTEEMISRASQALDAYQRLTAAGRLADAGRELEELRTILETLGAIGSVQSND
jgi:hypothetical protein